MLMKKIVILVALLLIPMVHAQLDWSITDFRCGNGKLDQFELCEAGVEESYCDELADLLGLDNACDTEHCTCLPRIMKSFCDNNIREGVELCDGTAEDLCPEFGKILNVSLTCNKKTCGCDINQTVPQDYDPGVVEGLINASQTASSCGDKKVERDEDCDPPNTLCTTSTQDPGICTEKCKCVLPSMLGVDEPEETPEPENITAENVTGNVTDNVTVENVTFEVENVTEEVDEEEEEKKPGFFSRMWAWIAGLFS